MFLLYDFVSEVLISLELLDDASKNHTELYDKYKCNMTDSDYVQLKNHYQIAGLFTMFSSFPAVVIFIGHILSVTSGSCCTRIQAAIRWPWKNLVDNYECNLQIEMND